MGLSGFLSSLCCWCFLPCATSTVPAARGRRHRPRTPIKGYFIASLLGGAVGRYWHTPSPPPPPPVLVSSSTAGPELGRCPKKVRPVQPLFFSHQLTQVRFVRTHVCTMPSGMRIGLTSLEFILPC